jgi:glycosyltransferase involved in cell wall biosynthesis
VKIYWYWPFLREEELGVVEAAVQPGDELIVQSLARAEGAAARQGPGWSVRPSLPEVPPAREHTPSWFASRATTYSRRALERRRLERSFRPDLTHVMFLNYFTDAARLRAGLGGRAVRVSSVHDAVPHQPRLSPRVQHAVLRRLYEVSGHLVVHHDHVAHRLTADFEVPADRITTIPLQVPDFGPRGRQPMPTEPRVLFFGTFRRNKGIEDLLEAIRLLGDRTEYRFTIAGRGDDKLMAMVGRAAEADPRITAELGYVPAARKSELTAAARLMVLPYTSFASQSAVLHDAYGHGRPVLVSDVGALGDTVREDGTGEVVPPSAPRELAAAIDQMLESAATTDAAGRAARRVADGRTPVVVGARLRSLYDQLLSTEG